MILVTEYKLENAVSLKAHGNFSLFQIFSRTILILNSITHFPHHVFSYLSEQEPQFLDHQYISVTYENTLLTIASSVCLEPKVFNIEINPEI